MLQPPSHLSKVCGHGHIKKFWLMQTQKENQSCDTKSSNFVPFPPSSPDSNGASMRGFASPSALPRLVTSCSYAQSCENKSCTFLPSPSSSDVNRGSPRMRDSGADPPRRATTCGLAATAAGIGKHSTLFFPEPSSPASSSGFWKEETAYRRLSTEDGVHMESFSDADVNRHYSPPSPSEGRASDLEFGGDRIRLSDHKSLSSDCHRNSHSDRHSEPSSAGSPCESKCHALQVTVDDHFEFYQRNTKEEPSDGNVSSPPRKLGAGSRAADDKPQVKQAVDSAFAGSPSSEEGTQAVLKSCTLCGTTKTPMWRSGPQGPKSLCNACGIRFKKYRALPGTTESAEGAGVSNKYNARPTKRKPQNSILAHDLHTHQSSPKHFSDDSRHQKKSKWHQLMMKRSQADVFDNSSAWKVSSGPASLKKIYGCMQSRLKNLGSIGEHITVNRVFAKDEEDAAVLLMHLSCGLAC